MSYGLYPLPGVSYIRPMRTVNISGGPITINSDDYLIIVTGAGTQDLNLPQITEDGREIRITSEATLNVIPYGSDTFIGGTTWSFSSRIRLVTIGTNWARFI